MNKIILSIFIISVLNGQNTDSLKLIESDSLKIDESEVVKRLDQLRVELRRLGKAQLRYQNRRIFFEGDRMELV